MRFYKYTVLYSPEKDGKETYYNVTIPAYPEICTFGDSFEEARFMAQDALELSIQSNFDENIAPRSDKKPRKISRQTVTEEIVVGVLHQVSATPFDYVKNALFKTA